MTEAVKKTIKLYGDGITIEFNSLARNRYVVLEDGHSPVGVTTILQILNKPGLQLWPMYEALDWIKKNGAVMSIALSETESELVRVFTEGLLEEAAKAYLIKSDKGKDVGSWVHTQVERFLNDDLESQQEDDKYKLLAIDYAETGEQDGVKAINAFQDWYLKTQPKVLATEQIIYSKLFDYAGTYDALLEIDGKVVLVDVKTTNSSRTAPLGIYPEMMLQLGGYSLAHHEENPQEQIDDLMVIRVGKDGILNTLRASELGFTPQFLEDAFSSLVGLYKFMTPLSKQLTERKV